MRYYSRLQRIRNTRKRKLLYIKVIRVGIVPLVLAIFLYLSMVSQKIEEVDQKEKTTSHFVPDGASRDKEVAGESTELVRRENNNNPTVTIAPKESIQKPFVASSAKPTQTYQQPLISKLSPTPKITQTVIPTPTPEAFTIPSYMINYTGSNTVSINQGTITFRFNYPEVDEEKFLVLGNFNGLDLANSFLIFVDDGWLGFDTYDNNIMEGRDSPNVYLEGDDLQTPFVSKVGDYLGKTYEVRVAWDFTVTPAIKRIYINGVLRKEIYPQVLPNILSNRILTSDVENLKISDKWEDK